MLILLPFQVGKLGLSRSNLSNVKVHYNLRVLAYCQHILHLTKNRNLFFLKLLATDFMKNFEYSGTKIFLCLSTTNSAIFLETSWFQKLSKFSMNSKSINFQLETLISLSLKPISSPFSRLPQKYFRSLLQLVSWLAFIFWSQAKIHFLRFLFCCFFRFLWNFYIVLCIYCWVISISCLFIIFFPLIC